MGDVTPQTLRMILQTEGRRNMMLREIDRHRSVQKGPQLNQRIELSVVHIDHHALMIDPRTSLQAHTPLETRTPLQAHTPLEEAHA